MIYYIGKILEDGQTFFDRGKNLLSPDLTQRFDAVIIGLNQKSFHLRDLPIQSYL